MTIRTRFCPFPGDADFDRFWSIYPRRVKKGDARKAWMQTAEIRPPIEELLAAVTAAKRTEQWRKDGGTFIPYPATWLRAEQWEDEHEVDLLTETQARPWHETASGIEAKGAELGILPGAYAHFQAFRAAVLQAARATVVQMKRA